MPKVSIIIPVYNVERYLSRCLESVINQTMGDFEVICVNDGSSDKCSEILECYQKNDKRLYILNQENQGLSMARNNGLKLASGEYVYFLDSDDAMHPQCLEVVLHIADKYKADLVCFQYKEYYLGQFDEREFFNKKIKLKESGLTISYNPLYLMYTKDKKKIHYNVWSKFYKRSLLEGIDFIKGIHFQDYPHTFEVLLRHPKTIVMGESLYLYTINPNSISNQRSNIKQIKDHHIAVSHVCDIYSNGGDKTNMEYLKKHFIPSILKQQLIKCKNADATVENLMYAELKKEFKELNSRGMLNWLDGRVLKCFLYCYLLK